MHDPYAKYNINANLPSGVRKMKIFYLEQNDMLQKAVEIALKNKSVDVYAVSPDDDFQHILDDWGADLLLVDYSSVGGELSRYLHTQIPLVVTSESEIDEGEFEVVLKPLKPVSLAEHLLELIKK